MNYKQWTDEEIDYLIDNCRKRSYKEIAGGLKRSYFSVANKAINLGIHNRRRWTPKEIEYLKENFGRSSNANLAKRFKRTIVGVRCKAKELGLGTKASAYGYITLSAIHRAMFPSHHNVSNMLRRYLSNGLKIRVFHLSSTNPDKKSYLVSIDDFWEWAEEHKYMVKFAKMEENKLGAEPQWVKEKRRQEWLENSNKRWAGKE